MSEPELALDKRDEEGAGRPQPDQFPLEELLGRPVRVVLVLRELGVEVVTLPLFFTFDGVADRALDLLAPERVRQRVVSHGSMNLTPRQSSAMARA